MEVDDNSTSATTEGKPVFDGEVDTISRLWFHVDIKAALDPKLGHEARKCAYVATCLGPGPLKWMMEKVRVYPALLTDYQLLKDAFNATYELPETVRLRLAEDRIMRLRQTGSAALYTSEFDTLVTTLGWPFAARRALYFAGLKASLQEKLILNDSVDNYDTIKEEAIRLDTSLGHNHKTSSSSSAPKKKEKKKCAKCGRTNHKTEDCFATSTIKVVTVLGQSLQSTAQQVGPLLLQGQRLRALVDTGAMVNCIDSNLATGPRHQSRMVLLGPNGSEIAHDAEYVVDQVDGIQHKFYLVQGLTEQVLLGLPYLDQGKNDVTFSIETDSPVPDGGRLRQLSSVETAAMEEYVTEKLATGVIRPSHAPAAANILFVPKKDGQLRLCVDYRGLNSVTRKDKYPLPLLRELIRAAEGHQFYCTLDIKDAFNHIQVRLGDEAKTAFKTNQGMFEYTRMPFGVTNGPSVFQRFIDRVMYPHRSRSVVYLDDILIFSNDFEEIVNTVSAVRKTLEDNAIPVNEKKCQPIGTEVIFVGVRITPEAVEPIMDIESIRDWPAPTNKNEMQQFLGSMNWFRDFVPSFATYAAPLYGLTGTEGYNFSPLHRQAFDATRNAVCQAIRVTPFDPKAEIHIYTDASLYGLGAIMHQGRGTIAVVSRSLLPAERNYTTTEREMLAIVFCVKRWRHFLESTHSTITVHTDHQVLTQRYNQDGVNRRINRWTEALMPYPIIYVHVRGVDNPADFPSRRPDYQPISGTSQEEGGEGGE